MAQSWKLTVRVGSKVTTERFASLDAALDAMAHRLDASSGDAHRDTARVFHRRIDPVAQVAVRAEVAGPQRFLAKVTAGVDLRGDASAEAWTGRVSKQVVQPHRGETAVDALRRVLTAA
ncbi:hypothetical protein [Capillimicrobium parvum]|uniref:Uncharacterized protein n=1 Tax=Capillimicrobium parvum TaxID=2884022 RepID=A0A9E7BZ52_9ACTN|nr:hypothetical protein [Capillimicrobium parvum]UGS34122.1 hypothetical protein DSM104329_00493 [Capillimicrobium parvum]